MLFDKFIASSHQYDKNADLEVNPISLQTAKTKMRFADLLLFALYQKHEPYAIYLRSNSFKLLIFVEIYVQ